MFVLQSRHQLLQDEGLVTGGGIVVDNERIVRVFYKGKRSSPSVMSLKTKNCHNANYVVTGGEIGYHHVNLRAMTK